MQQYVTVSMPIGAVVSSIFLYLNTGEHYMLIHEMMQLLCYVNDHKYFKNQSKPVTKNSLIAKGSKGVRDSKHKPKDYRSLAKWYVYSIYSPPSTQENLGIPDVCFQLLVSPK